MAKHTPQTWTDGVSALSAARMLVLEHAAREASMGRSTTFPATPVDGDIHVYPADLTNGIMWHFMYRTAPNDWEFIGGSPLYAEVETAESTTSTSYVALATAGPSIALPFIGDWMVEIGAHMTNTGANGDLMGYDIGGTGAIDADAIQISIPTASFTFNGFRKRRKAGLTAVTLTAKYKVGAGTGTFSKRWMAVTPIRHTP